MHTDHRNAGYHRIREDYEIRSKQELKKQKENANAKHDKIEYSNNSSDEWDIRSSFVDSSDESIVMSPSRFVYFCFLLILLILLMYLL